MDPEQIRLVKKAGTIVAAHFHDDITGRDGLLDTLGSTVEESAHLAPKAFTYLGLAVAGVTGRLEGLTEEEVLAQTPPRDGLLIPGTPTAWQAAVDLFVALHHNDPDIDQVSSRMDVRQAIASTFSVAVALVAQLARSVDRSPGEVAMMFSEIARDYFVSYTGADHQWAEWISWELEQAGYSVVLQAWDFTAGSHFVREMHNATQVASRTISVLSRAYIASAYTEAEWQEAWRADPTGAQRKLLVFRVEDCPRPGLLGQVVSVDLFGVNIETARSRLLTAVRSERRKPALPPQFPLQEPPSTEPRFPGMVPGNLSDAAEAGGPMTPDNPYAVAFALWSAILDKDYRDLDRVITPESRGRWDLETLHRETESSGLATGVFKPVFDVAYVRLVSGIGNETEDVLQVLADPIPVNARVISLVYRPELGGWRAHGLGRPVDPRQLPRG
jgi:hypothetical protein